MSHSDYRIRMRNYWLQAIILCVLGALSLSGCAGLLDARPIANTPAPPKKINLPTPPKPQRELGSLWSEQSVWNDIYSVPPTRVVGDVLEVRLSERFRKQILRRLKREHPLRVVTKVDVGEDAKKIDPKVKVEPTSDELSPDDSLTMHATITEVMPRGVYKLAASETLRIGSRDPVVSFEGEVRDKDIEANESIDADKILNIAMDLKPYGAQRRLAKED